MTLQQQSIHPPQLGDQLSVRLEGLPGLERHTRSADAPAEQPLSKLIALNSRSISQIAAAITTLSFDLLCSPEHSVREAALRMIGTLEGVSREIDQQWKLVSEVTGAQPEHMIAVEDVLLSALPTSEYA